MAIAFKVQDIFEIIGLVIRICAEKGAELIKLPDNESRTERIMEYIVNPIDNLFDFPPIIENIDDDIIKIALKPIIKNFLDDYVWKVA
jgi:hypothetical protein